MPRVTRTTLVAPEVPPPAVDFLSVSLGVEAGNHLGIRLYQDLREVSSVAGHTMRIFGTEQVGKALRKLRPIEGMPIFPEPLSPSSFTAEVWYKVFNLFTKACLGAPGIKGKFRTCTSIEGTRSTVLRWAEILSQWKPKVPSLDPLTLAGAGSENGSAGKVAGDASNLAMMAASIASLTSVMAEFIQSQKKSAQVVDTASLQKSLDPEVPIGAGASREKEPAVGDKRRRAVSWMQELEDIVGDTSEDDDPVILGTNQKLGADPTAGVASGANLKNGTLKPGEMTPTKGRAFKGILSGLLQNSISPQQQHQIDQSAQADRFARAEAQVGMSVDSRSLKAIDLGMLAKVQLGHFAPSSGSISASNSAAERNCVWFSFADGKFEQNSEDKFKFSSIHQFVSALDNFVRVWKVLKPESHLESLGIFRDLIAEWASTEVAPVAILVDLWVEHKRKVAARRFSTPPFDWLDNNRDTGRLQFRLQAVVLQQISLGRVKDNSPKQGSVRQLTPPKKEKSPGNDQHEDAMSRKKTKKLAYAAKVGAKEDKSGLLCKYGNDGCRAVFLSDGQV